MKKSVQILVVLFSLAACSQGPVFTFEVITPAPTISPTPWVEGTELAIPSPTPWVGGTETASAASQIPLPTFAPPLMEKPTDFSPVLYGGKVFDTTAFLLLGGVSSDSWLTPEFSIARFNGEVTYSLYTLTQQSKYFVWGKTAEISPTCPAYSIATDATLEEASFVGVVDIWPVSTREVTELSTGLYQQTVLDWLKAEGVIEPELGDLQVYRVDLEGDGTDEIFISATRYDGSQRAARTGDHSIILMRKVQGNEAITVLITGDVYRVPETGTILPKTYSIANFVDLNQDGVLEVVIDIQRWEGFGAAVYQVENQTITEVLHAGCGL